VYLGNVIGHGKLKIDPSKVSAIVDWPKPTNVTEVRGFLGAFPYLRKSIIDFSHTASPLYDVQLTRGKFSNGRNNNKHLLTP